MGYPAFFEQVPRIAMIDPLAQFLGASPEGRIEYGYLDAVKLAGHSCPTVAGAWLMAARGLSALCPDRAPERGAIQVSFRDARTDGVTGVIANVLGLITGAAGEEGFKGLNGRFCREGLMRFDAPIEGEVRFANADGAVDLWFDAEAVPLSAEARKKMQAALQPGASPEAREAFAVAFQERVRQILIDRSEVPGLIVVRPA